VRAAVAPLGEILEFTVDERGLAVEDRRDAVPAGDDAWVP
jgi:hypothetical protein